MHQKKVDIILASHLHNMYRYNTIQECLHSMLNQTIPFNNIYVSYSVEKGVPDPREQLKDSRITWIFQPTRKSQFEHINNILETCDVAEWICFQDDDDVSLPTRHDDFLRNMDNQSDYYVSRACITMRGLETSRDPVSISELPQNIIPKRIVEETIRYCRYTLSGGKYASLRFGMFDLFFMAFIRNKYMGKKSEGTQYIKYTDSFSADRWKDTENTYRYTPPPDES